MAQSFNEIWMHVGSQTWKTYKNVTDDIRMELYRNGWTQVCQNKNVEDSNERKITVKNPKKKNSHR